MSAYRLPAATLSTTTSPATVKLAVSKGPDNAVKLILSVGVIAMSIGALGYHLYQNYFAACKCKSDCGSGCRCGTSCSCATASTTVRKPGSRVETAGCACAINGVCSCSATSCRCSPCVTHNRP